MQRLKIYYGILLSLGLVGPARGIHAAHNSTPPFLQDASPADDQRAGVSLEARLTALKKDRLSTAAAVITARKYGYKVQNHVPRGAVPRSTDSKRFKHERRAAPVGRPAQACPFIKKTPKTVIKKSAPPSGVSTRGTPKKRRRSH